MARIAIVSPRCHKEPAPQTLYDPDHFGSNAEAKAARNVDYKYWSCRGYTCRRWVLKNSERGYSGYGTARDTSRRTVYVLNIDRDETWYSLNIDRKETQS